MESEWSLQYGDLVSISNIERLKKKCKGDLCDGRFMCCR